MQRTRQVIVVALVATALCAGRIATVAPQQPPVAQMAGRLIHRLGRSFSRVVPTARLYQPRREESRPVHQPTCVRPDAIPLIPVCLSPFQFRLPPPLA
jgi:hypothetical protein